MLGITRKSTLTEHFIATVIITLIVAMIALVFKSIVNIYGLIGGIAYNCIGFIFPFMVEIKISKKPWYHPYNLFILLLIILFMFMGFTSAIIAMLDTAGYVNMDVVPCKPAYAN